MPAIKPCDEEAMLARVGMSQLVLWPCVIAPLTFALLAMAVAWMQLWIHRKSYYSSPLVIKGWMGVLSVETIFGSACFVQCLLNVSHEGKFFGGSPNCSLMAWYVGFYMITWPLLCALLSLFTRVVALDDPAADETSFYIPQATSLAF